MTDTLFADVSEFQRPVNDTYPYRFISIRANDGTYRDRNFAVNYAWCKSAVARGRLDGFIVYFVWHPNWQDGIATLKTMVGTPHPKMAVMIDVESWGGKIKGNQSLGINAARDALVTWLGDKRRVIGYANAGDFAALWPTREDCKVILANYSTNPDFPNKIAHQFSSSFATAPFGPCDINSADGRSSIEFAVALGLAIPPTIPTPTPVVITKPIQLPEGVAVPPGFIHRYGGAGKPGWPGIFLVAVDLSHKIHIVDSSSSAFLTATKLYPASGLTDAMVNAIPTVRSAT